MSQPDWYMQFTTNGQFREDGNHLWGDSEFGDPRIILSLTSLPLNVDFEDNQVELL